MLVDFILPFFDITTVLLVTVLTVLLYYCTPKRPPGVPPGPPVRWPLIGNLLELGDKDQRNGLRRLRKKYGNIYSLCIGSKLGIFICGYENIRDAFVKNGEQFAERAPTLISEQLSKGHGIVLSSGHRWKEHRKFALVTLRSFDFGKSRLESKIHTEVELLLDYLQGLGGSPVNLRQHFQTSAANVISSMVFGGQFKQNDPMFEELSWRIDEIFKTSASTGLLQFFPYLRFLPGDMFGYKHLSENVERVIGFFRKLIQDKIESFDENNIEDFTGAYIKEMKAQEKINKDTTFDLEQFVWVVSDFFIGGTETTAVTLLWMLVYFLNFPTCQDQVLQEIDKHVGRSRLPSLQDRPKMPYTDAFIMESMRHNSIGILTLPKSTPRDIEFKGYVIPKEAMIFEDFDSLMIDPEHWDDPEVFRPERFLTEEGQLKKNEAFIPFGVGRRSCIGESLAKMELFLFMTALVQRFCIQAPDSEDVRLQTLDGVFGLTHTPKPFSVRLVSRKD